MTFRLRPAVIAGSVSLALAGCANPTFIGVQDYGSVYGNAVSNTNAAIPGAYVGSTGTTAIVQTAPNGSFTLSNVAVGEQTLMIQAPGYMTATTTIVITKDQSVNAGNVSLTLTSSTPIFR